jgi:hypothetical protein
MTDIGLFFGEDFLVAGRLVAGVRKVVQCMGNLDTGNSRGRKWEGSLGFIYIRISVI